jgi:ABC-type lipoprotein export system ATPase subunit
MTESSDILLEARHLRKSYGRGLAGVEVLKGLDLAVRRGEFVAVMGPSGCGKSTLLHLLGLMTIPDRAPDGGQEGRIIFDGQAVPASGAIRNRLRRKRIGFVFQRFNLLGVLSASDNVAISLKVRGFRDTGLADELFDAMGVGHVRDRKPGKMSIGEQQRVAVVRALAHQPDLLLADEPTGNLDGQSSEALLELLEQIHRQRGHSVVMITHSAEAAAHADRILLMKDGRLHEPDAGPA